MAKSRGCHAVACRARNMHLARPELGTHVHSMQALSKSALLGFVELQVGSLAVQVPIRAADESTPESATVESLPLASFTTEGDACAILVRGDTSSAQVEHAVREAAREAVVHLSRKLLN